MTPTARTRFAELLRSEMSRAGINQKKLAVILDRDASSISVWLKGRQTPRPDDTDLLTRLAQWLGRPIEEVREVLLAQRAQPTLPSPANADLPVTLRSEQDLERVLDERPALLEQAFPMGSISPVESLREKLLEAGYAAELTLVQRVIGRRSLPMSSLTTTTDGQISRLAAPAQHAKLPLSRDSVRQLCSAFNTAFEGRIDGDLSMDDLQDLSEKQLNLTGPAARRDVVTLVDHMKAARLLESVPGGRLRRRWILNPEYLINTVAGLRTHVPGLDFLLDGGLLPPQNGGLSMLIKGRPGVGKSMLSIQLAASIAAQGNLSLYFAAEESPQTLLERLSFAGYYQKATTIGKHVIDLARGQQHLQVVVGGLGEADEAFTLSHFRPESGQGKKGMLWLIEVPNRRDFLKRDLGRRAYDIADKLAAQEIHTCYVFDPIDWVLEDATARIVHDQLFQRTRHPMGIGIFVSEVSAMEPPPHGRPQQAAIRDHMADILVRMDYRNREPVYSHFIERVIEIQKARTQRHIRGEHPLAIRPGEGIHIDSSVQSRLSLWRRYVGREEAPACSWYVDPNLDFDTILHGDVVRGSINLICGPPSTHKFNVGLAFLAAELVGRKDAGEPPGHVILVSLREDQESILRVIRNYDQFSVLLDADRRHLSENVRILHLPPDFFTAERFLEWLRDALRDKERRPTRLLFSTLRQLNRTSPVIFDEQMAIAGAIALFRRKRLTTLFIDVGTGEDREHGFPDPFDTIIYTGHQDPVDPESVAIRVGHSWPCNADRHWHTFRRIDGPKGARLSLNPDPVQPGEEPPPRRSLSETPRRSPAATEKTPPRTHRHG